MSNRFREWLKFVFKKPSPKASLNVDREGFSIHQEGGEPTIHVFWNEIAQIQAYKKDLLTEDLVCWDITVTKDENSQTYTVHEALDGFELLVDRVSNELVSFDKTWRDKVIQPPFSKNCTVLYQKATGQ